MIIRLKLGRSQKVSTEKAFKQLSRVRDELNLAAREVGYVWRKAQRDVIQRSHPSGFAIAKKKKDGRQVVVHPERNLVWCATDPSAKLITDGIGLEFPNLKHVASGVSPSIAALHVGSMLDDYQTDIGSKIEYTYNENAKERGNGKSISYRWQAIMKNERPLPFFRRRAFSVNKQTWGLAWEGNKAGSCWDSLAEQSVEQSKCLFRVTLFGRDSGMARHRRAITFEINVGKIGAKQKAMLRSILDPSHHFAACDSQIVQSRKGDWFLHLVFKDTRDLPKCEFDDLTAAELICNHAGGRYGFLLLRPDGSRKYFGPSEWIKHRNLQVTTLRRHMQSRHPKGHGTDRHLLKHKELTRGKEVFWDSQRKSYIAELVRELKKCGATCLLYREPTLGKGTRSIEWFASNGINWDWTEFLREIKAKLNNPSVRLGLKKQRMNKKEFKAVHELA